MTTLDPRMPGIMILASSAVFLFFKRWTTGPFLKGRPDRKFSLWFTHAFNLFFLMAVNPAVAILLVVRRLETLDPTIVDPAKIPLHLGLEASGLLLCLGGNSLMCGALVTMRGHFQVLAKASALSDRIPSKGMAFMGRPCCRKL